MEEIFQAVNARIFEKEHVDLKHLLYRRNETGSECEQVQPGVEERHGEKPVQAVRKDHRIIGSDQRNARSDRHAGGHRKSREQRHCEQLTAYTEKLREYTEKLRICGPDP
ncbi:MAG: hypothetical protein II117_03035 [Clostridia bacterium]|nr:hypothetical protein [Clostridia bacterium]